MPAFRICLISLVCGSLYGCENYRQPLITTQGKGGDRLDTVFVQRGDRAVPVGIAGGVNTSGAGPEEPLVNSEGRPLGGSVIAVVYENFIDGGVPPAADMAGAQDMAAPDGSVAEDMTVPAPDMNPGGMVGDGGVVGDGGAPADLAPAPPGPPALAQATDAVTLGQWLGASFEARVTPKDRGHYEFRLNATNLIPNGLYSVWLQYVTVNPSPVLYAIAPVGGLPTSFIAGPDGSFEFVRLVRNEFFEVSAETSIPNAVRVGGSDQPAKVTSATSIVVTLVYHSSGQTNGNASLQPPGTPVIPTEAFGLIGRVGQDIHLQISAIPMPSIPRRNP